MMKPVVPPFGFLGRIFLQPEDERVYAVMRIGFAIASLYNLALLWPLRDILFANTGSIDLDAVVDMSPMGSVLLFHWFQTPGQVALMMILAAAAMLLLLLGILPRLAAAGVYLWYLSYIERAPVALGGWDAVLRSFAFLMLVSPMGRYWSLPAWWHKRPEPAQVARYGLLLMQLQVAVIYLETITHRLINVNPYWRDGEFLSYFLMSHNSRWPGTWAAEYADILMLGTYLTMLTEAVIPILLLIKRTRWWGILLGLLFHGLISILARNIEPFLVIMAMSYLAFLTGADVDRVQRRLCRWFGKKTDVKPAAARLAS